MEGEEVSFLLFLLIWKDKVFCLHTQKVGSKSCRSPQKFSLVSWIDFKSWKIFRGGKRPKGIEE